MRLGLERPKLGVCADENSTQKSVAFYTGAPPSIVIRRQNFLREPAGSEANQNFNLLQLECVVMSVAQKGRFSRLTIGDGFDAKSF